VHDPWRQGAGYQHHVESRKTEAGQYDRNGDQVNLLTWVEAADSRKTNALSDCVQKDLRKPEEIAALPGKRFTHCSDKHAEGFRERDQHANLNQNQNQDDADDLMNDRKEIQRQEPKIERPLQEGQPTRADQRQIRNRLNPMVGDLNLGESPNLSIVHGSGIPC
jgi:hypothetical protein